MQKKFLSLFLIFALLTPQTARPISQDAVVKIACAAAGIVAIAWYCGAESKDNKDTDDCACETKAWSLGGAVIFGGITYFVTKYILRRYTPEERYASALEINQRLDREGYAHPYIIDLDPLKRKYATESFPLLRLARELREKHEEAEDGLQKAHKSHAEQPSFNAERLIVSLGNKAEATKDALSDLKDSARYREEQKAYAAQIRERAAYFEAQSRRLEVISRITFQPRPWYCNHCHYHHCCCH